MISNFDDDFLSFQVKNHTCVSGPTANGALHVPTN